MNRGFLSRIGTFFYLIGIGLMILFISSAFSRETNFSYFLWAAAFLYCGYLFQRRNPEQKSERFKTFRKVRDINRQRREEKQNKEPQKYV
jgi:hypothetical protein